MAVSGSSLGCFQARVEPGWPTFHYSVEVSAELKLSPDGKLVEAPAKPAMTLAPRAFPTDPAAIEESAEGEPFQLSFKIREVNASLENVRWQDDKSKTIAFAPRYIIEFTFLIGEPKSGVSLEGGGGIGVSGNTQTEEFFPTPNGSTE